MRTIFFSRSALCTYVVLPHPYNLLSCSSFSKLVLCACLILIGVVVTQQKADAQCYSCQVPTTINTTICINGNSFLAQISYCDRVFTPIQTYCSGTDDMNRNISIKQVCTDAVNSHTDQEIMDAVFCKFSITGGNVLGITPPWTNNLYCITFQRPKCTQRLIGTNCIVACGTGCCSMALRWIYNPGTGAVTGPILRSTECTTTECGVPVGSGLNCTELDCVVPTNCCN